VLTFTYIYITVTIQFIYLVSVYLRVLSYQLGISYIVHDEYILLPLFPIVVKSFLS